MKNKQSFILFAFLCFFSLNNIFAANLGPKIVLTNWVNPMDSQGCIVVEEGGNYILKIEVTITVGDNDISTFPSLYYSYDFGGLDVGRSALITNANFTPFNDNGNNVYRATFSHQMSFAQTCEGPNVTTAFDYSINLETRLNPTGAGSESQGATFIDYPVASYVGTLFPAYLFFDENGLPIDPTSLISGQKDVCCVIFEGEERSSTTSEEASTLQSSTVTSSDFQISPNPFRDEFTIAFENTPERAVQVELFNASGKRVIFKQITGEISNTLRIDTQELANGFYYCRVNGGKSHKIIKLGY